MSIDWQAEPRVDEHELNDWCNKKHPSLDPHHCIIESGNYQSLELGMRQICQCCWQLREEQTTVLELKEIFGLIDTDGGGSIDKDEFYELMCMVGLGDMLSRDESDAMIDKVDGDGSGEVEFDEFLEVMSHSLLLL